MHSSEMNDIEVASAGDICAFFGVDCASGDTFGDGKAKLTMTSMFVPNAVISLAIQPKDKTGQTNFSKALNKFHEESPTFLCSSRRRMSQTIISGMGEATLKFIVSGLSGNITAKSSSVSHRSLSAKR